ncbi:MFS transporter [Streptomyces sp. SL13]|uniref:MFS transporter n=1 Tax=Streptantibioticus silvisoli TaxID=2705255 RepID=A0AA90H8T5_9ACTN|nr:MFS transporter [Streptantibioticus silvisoli]MDI5970940.1 MFS transporter [Streptantibioticus silvisoli]
MTLLSGTRTEQPGTAWAPRHRALSTGILLLVTLMAFESLGVNTAIPTLVADLHGTGMYTWPFVAFLGSSVVATVLAGQLCDRRGPRPALALGPLFFLAGLVVAGSAGSMSVLLVGRALQGFGDGMLIVPVYVLIGLVYGERDQLTMFATLSAAYVVPALVGPALAGWLTERFTWRLVFFAIVPFAVLGFALLLPVLRSLPSGGAPVAPARRGLPVAALAGSAGIAAIGWAAQHPTLPSLLLGAAAIAVLVPSLRVLLPPGTLRARRGLPVTVLARGLLAGTFFGTEAFIPYTLTAVHGYSPPECGVPLTLSALGWAAGSWWQSRHPGIPRERLVRAGFVLTACGSAGLTAVAFPAGPAWATAGVWAVAGAGMGLAVSSLSAVALSLAGDADRGFTSSALQITDMLGTALLVGLAGTVVTGPVAARTGTTTALVVLDLLMAAGALTGAVLTGARCRP